MDKLSENLNDLFTIILASFAGTMFAMAVVIGVSHFIQKVKKSPERGDKKSDEKQ